MSMRDEDYGAALTLAEGDDGIWSPPMARVKFCSVQG